MYILHFSHIYTCYIHSVYYTRCTMYTFLNYIFQDCYTNLCKRHRDPDEKVRLEAVKVVYAIASDDITRMTPELFMILQVNVQRSAMSLWPQCFLIY